MFGPINPPEHVIPSEPIGLGDDRQYELPWSPSDPGELTPWAERPAKLKKPDEPIPDTRQLSLF